MASLFYLLRGLLAVAGAILGRVFGVRSESENRRRELRVNVLVEAWRNIERAAMRAGAEEMRGLERALADIQLFGTPAQVEHAASVARSMNERRRTKGQVGDLLEALRLELRTELRLGRTDSPFVSLREASPAVAPPEVAPSSVALCAVGDRSFAHRAGLAQVTRPVHTRARRPYRAPSAAAA
jgi:hypothetical protein